MRSVPYSRVAILTVILLVVGRTDHASGQLQLPPPPKAPEGQCLNCPPDIVTTPSFIYSPPPASASLTSLLQLQAAQPVSEEYRSQFDACDQADVFRGEAVARIHRCSRDPNRVKALLRLPDGSTYVEAKMSLDLDGTWWAWNVGNDSTQRATSFEWRIPACRRDRSGQECQVNGAAYPYVVLPCTAKEFGNKTGVHVGDFGVVIYGDKWVAVFVADCGPKNKIGEASPATFRALGLGDRCRLLTGDLRTAGRGPLNCTKYNLNSIPDSVVYVLFPDSKDLSMTPSNAKALAQETACRNIDLPGCGPRAHIRTLK